MAQGDTGVCLIDTMHWDESQTDRKDACDGKVTRMVRALSLLAFSFLEHRSLVGRITVVVD